jgi:hypothetical protein
MIKPLLEAVQALQAMESLLSRSQLAKWKTTENFTYVQSLNDAFYWI